MQRIVLNDMHIPFESKMAIRAVLDAVQRIKPEGIDLLGDLADCYTVSKFSKDPSRRMTFKQEVNKVKTFLQHLVQVAPRRCDIRFSDGNHEDRIRKTRWELGPGFGSLDQLNSQALYGLADLGMRYYPYTKPYQIGQLWFHHGKVLRRWSGGTAQASIQAAGGSVIVGHCHRLAHVFHTTWSSTFQGWENGCLCTLNPEWLHGPPDWQHGFALIRYGKRRSFGVQQIQIRKGRYWLDGKEYKP